MKNVYDQVQAFYEELTEEQAIKREWIEGFLRQKAWQGVEDAELTNAWHNIRIFMLYLLHSGNDELDEITHQEYSVAIAWITENVPDFKASVKPVRQLFSILIEFYHYLFGKKIIDGFGELEQAAKEIAGGKKLNLTRAVTLGDELGLFADLEKVFGKSHTALTENMGVMVGETIERLMLKLGTYFQQKNFNEDFDRALYLYTGPFDSVPDDEQDEFWLGFWDYFLFDYHLLANDATPLNHFFTTNNGRLNVDERQILQDLLSAKFTVFYINKVLNQDWVECINLFTGETFQLPFPDFDYRTLKKLLFFGHVFSQGLVMINYVTSIEVSPNLRRRIKDEVIRQTAIYAIQQPGAGLSDFFNRHALVVRHTIDVLLTLAKLNVTSAAQVERIFPIIEEKSLPNQEVVALIEEVMPDYGFSMHDIVLAQKMWHDFCQVTAIVVRKPSIWAATILYVYDQVNYTHNVAAEDISQDLGISSSSMYTNRNKLYEALQLQKFDPRYLSEEGFVSLLFMP
jgi:hypothetical protein